MQASVGGSARIQGVGSVAGLTNNGSSMNPGMQKAVIIWVVAVVVLAAFHVGGARI